MIARLVTGLGVLTGLLSVGASPLRAQSSPPFGDASGIIAWQGADVRSPDGLDRSHWAGSFFGAAVAGVYWNAHLKSELELGVSTTAEGYRSRRLVVDGVVTYQSSRLRFSRRTLAISQQYQFFENAWFHPHIAVGLNVTSERRTEAFLPAYVFNPTTLRTTIVDRGGTEGPTTSAALRPFVGGGFKAYMTPRWFFRADSRFAFKRRLDEVQLRVGFGRDW